MRCDQLAFAVSDRCNLECAHCCVESGPTRSATRLSAERMIALVDAMATRGPLRRVTFTGGEPTLFPDDVLPVIRHCAGLGVETRLVTNASWARTDAAAMRLVERYAAAGLTEVAVSESAYHRAFVGFERCLRATRAALARGVAVQLLVTVGDGVTAEDVRARLAAVPLDDERLTVHAGPVIPAGRARRLPTPAFRNVRMADTERGGCGMLLNPAVVTPQGTLTACCGYPSRHRAELALGPLDDPESLSERLRAAQRDPILRWVHAVGPWRVLQAVNPGRYAPDTTVAGGHICGGCQLLFGDPENRARLHAYVARRGADLLFDECLEAFEPAEQAPA